MTEIPEGRNILKLPQLLTHIWQPVVKKGGRDFIASKE